MISRRAKSSGFTVVELIVAMSISAVTLLSGYELLQALKTVGDRQSADLAATAGIVRGMDRIREDLLHAVPRTGSKEPVFTGTNPDPDNTGETTQVLMFYSLCPDSGDSDFSSLRRMCQIRYELVTTGKVVCLYRSVTRVVGARQASKTSGRGLILDRVDQVALSFHNGQGSAPSFSSEKQLPVGVEMTVKAYGQAWPLSVRVPCGGSKEGS